MEGNRYERCYRWGEFSYTSDDLFLHKSVFLLTGVVLRAGETGDGVVRLLAGAPDLTKVLPDNRSLFFFAGGVFCFASYSGSCASAWVVQAGAGSLSLPFLFGQSGLLLEAAGRSKVRRLVSTLEVMDRHAVALDMLDIGHFTRWGSMLYSSKYSKEVIVREFTQACAT